MSNELSPEQLKELQKLADGILKEAKNVKEDYSWQSGSYRMENKIKVLRIKGTNLITSITEK